MDLTERKQAEDELQHAYADLSQSEAALMSALHELQTANEQLRTTQLQLIQAAKLESVGTLAAGVAHEVKNPFQTILMGLPCIIKPINLQELLAWLEQHLEAPQPSAALSP